MEGGMKFDVKRNIDSVLICSVLPQLSNTNYTSIKHFPLRKLQMQNSTFKILYQGA